MSILKQYTKPILSALAVYIPQVFNQYTKPVLSALAVYAPQVLEHYMGNHHYKGYKIKYSLLLQNYNLNSKYQGLQCSFHNALPVYYQSQPAQIIIPYYVGTHLAGDNASLIEKVATNVSSAAMLDCLLDTTDFLDSNEIQKFICYRAIPVVLLTLINHDYDKNTKLNQVDVQPQDIITTPEEILDQVDVQPQDIIFN